MYNAENFSKVAQEVYSPVKVSAQWLKDRCEELIPQVKEFIAAGIFTVKHEEFLAERRALAERILACDDVFGCAQLLGGLSLSSKPRNTSVKKSGDARAMELDDALASLKGRIDGMKKAVSEISDREQEFAAFMDSGKIAASLGALLLAFDENYARLKRRAGVLDFPIWNTNVWSFCPCRTCATRCARVINMCLSTNTRTSIRYRKKFSVLWREKTSLWSEMRNSPFTGSAAAVRHFSRKSLRFCRKQAEL